MNTSIKKIKRLGRKMHQSPLEFGLCGWLRKIELAQHARVSGAKDARTIRGSQARDRTHTEEMTVRQRDDRRARSFKIENARTLNPAGMKGRAMR